MKLKFNPLTRKLDIAGGGGSSPGGGVQSVVAGTNVTVDNTDPANPIVSSTGGSGGGVQSVTAGTQISVDNTDPANPIVSATGGSPSGIEGSVQFLWSGVFAGDTNLTYDPTTGVFSNYAVNQVQITRGWAGLPLQLHGGAGYEPYGGSGQNIYLYGGAKASSNTGVNWGEIAEPGSGYEPNAYVEVFLDGGDGTAVIAVETDGDGVPLYVSDVNARGYGYDLRTYYTIGGTGSGLTITVTSLSSVNIPGTYNGNVTCMAPFSVGGDDTGPASAQRRVIGTTDIVTDKIIATSGQTANISEWQDSSATVLAKITPTGFISATNINDTGILLHESNVSPSPTGDYTTLYSQLVGSGNQRLLMHFNTAIVDDSALQNVVNTAGVVASDTQTYFGAKSAYFDGSSYAIVDPSPGWDLGLGNFTIDFWMYRTDNSSYQYFGILSTSVDIYNEGWAIYMLNDDTMRLSNNGFSTDLVTSGSLTVPLNTWTHVALVRKGIGATDLNFYINGVAGDAPASGNVVLNRGTTNGELAIGRIRTQEPYWLYYGYIDELQIMKGVATWTTDFTPPTAEYAVEPTSVFITSKTSSGIVSSYKGVNTGDQDLTKRHVTTQGDDYTATATDSVIVCDKPTAMTITLPPATASGQTYHIKSIGAGAVTIDGDASETIDGETTQVIYQFEGVTITDYATGAWIVC